MLYVPMNVTGLVASVGVIFGQSNNFVRISWCFLLLSYFAI
jgi:hypothetical protein